MNSREVNKFFGINSDVTDKLIDEEKVDGLFINLFNSWTANQGSLALYLLSKYKKTYNETFKRKIMGYTVIVLLEPSIADQYPIIVDKGPLILLKKLMNSRFEENSIHFLDIVEEMILYTENETAKKVIIPIIYECSSKCSKLSYFDDYMVFTDTLEVLLTIEEIISWFQEEFLWGLADSPEYLRTDYFYQGFEYDTNTPCFLDGFLEIFIYKKGDIFAPAEFFHKETTLFEKNDIITTINNRIKTHTKKLYDMIMTVIKSNQNIKNNFLRFLFLVIKNNQNRNKMVYNYEKVISDGYAYNMNNLLLFLSHRIIFKEFFDLIDINFLTRLNLKGLNENVENEETNNNLDPIRKDEKISFSTVIFFSKVIFTNFSYLKLFDHQVHLLNEMNRIEMLLSENFASNTERLKQLLSQFQSKREAINYLTFIHFFKENEIPFIDFMLELTKIHSFEKFPSLYFDVIFELQEVIVYVHEPYLSSTLLALIENIMSSNLRNLHFKNKIVRVLKIKKTSFFLTDNLFQELVKFYSDVYNSDEFFNEKFQIRSNIHNIMLKDSSQKLRNIQPNKNNLRFVNYLIDDAQYTLSTGLNAIIQIKENEEKLKRIVAVTEREACMSSILKFKNEAQVSFMFAKTSLSMIQFLIEETEIFLRSEILKKFISILNCNLKIIVGPKCNNLKIKNSEAYNFKPKDLLGKILVIYSKMNKDEYFKAIVEDRSYYSITLFKKSLCIAHRKSILSSVEIEVFSSVIAKLEKFQNEITEEDHLIPDEFIDPITFNPIEDPVILLTSHVTVDRSTFDAIMLADQIDPFNREKLDETKIKEDVEMKSKLEKYKSERKQ